MNGGSANRYDRLSAVSSSVGFDEREASTDRQSSVKRKLFKESKVPPVNPHNSEEIHKSVLIDQIMANRKLRIEEIKQKQQKQSQETDMPTRSQSQVEEVAPEGDDFRSRVVKTSLTFYRRTGLRKDDDFKKYLLPYIKLSKAMAVDNQIEVAYKDMELNEFKMKHQQKVKRYLEWLDRQAKMRKKKYEEIKNLKVNGLVKYKDRNKKVIEVQSVNNSPRVASPKFKQYLRANTSPKQRAIKEQISTSYVFPAQFFRTNPVRSPAAVSTSFEITNFKDAVKSRQKPTLTQIKNAKKIIDDCTTASKGLNVLSKNFFETQSINEVDFSQLTNKIKLSESLQLNQKFFIF